MPGAGHQRAQRVGAEVGGVDLAQPATASPHGGADRIDDEGFGHRQISSRLGDALAVPGRIAVGAGEGPRALEEAVQVVLDGVADGAVALQGLPAAEAGGVGRHGLGHRDVAGLHRGRGAADRGPGEGELLERVGEVVLHRLERADRHAELLALLGVVDGQVEHPLAEPDELGGGAEREPVGVVAHRRLEDRVLEGDVAGLLEDGDRRSPRPCRARRRPPARGRDVTPMATSAS